MLKKLTLSEVAAYVVAGGLLLAAAGILFIGNQKNVAAVSSEIGIGSLSPRGLSGGVLVPASGCSGTESDCDTGGGSSCTITFDNQTPYVGDSVVVTVEHPDIISMTGDLCVNRDFTGCSSVGVGTRPDFNSWLYTVETGTLIPGEDYTFLAQGSFSELVCDSEGYCGGAPPITSSFSCAASIQMVLPPSPDIAATIDPVADLTVGEVLSISGLISNVGDASAIGGFDNRALIYQQNTDGSWPNTATYTGIPDPRRITANLAPDENQTVSWIRSGLTVGNYAVNIRAESSNEIFEVTANNNDSAYEFFTVSPAPQCRDGVDNDGDGLVDYPADPDCTGPDDDLELGVPTVTLTANPVAMNVNESSMLVWEVQNAATCEASGGVWSGPRNTERGSEATGAWSTPGTLNFVLTCTNIAGSNSATATVVVSDTGGAPQCSDRLDNDGDGLIDHPADPDCTGPDDDLELGVPTVTLTANPTTMEVNDASILTWNVEDAVTCEASGDWSGPRNTVAGSDTTGPWATAETLNYTLTCTNAAGSGSDTATVVVNDFGGPPSAVDLTVTVSSSFGHGTTDNDGPVSVASDDTLVLEWDSTGASSCTAVAGPGFDTGNNTDGSTVVSTPGPGDSNIAYTVSCSNGAGSIEDTVIVNVYALPLLTLQACDASGNSCQSGTKRVEGSDQVQLRWTSTNANVCNGFNFATGGDLGSVTPGLQLRPGSEPTIGSDINYILTCTGPGGHGTPANVMVQRNAAGLSLTADPTILHAGDDTILEWNTGSFSPASCSVTGPGITTASPLSLTSGSETVTVNSQSTFTLNCMGSEVQETIIVLPDILET